MKNKKHPKEKLKNILKNQDQNEGAILALKSMKDYLLLRANEYSKRNSPEDQIAQTETETLAQTCQLVINSIKNKQTP